MKLNATDTSPEAKRLQARAHRALGPNGRVEVALELSEAVRELRLSCLRSTSPDASRQDLVKRFISEVHGIPAERLE
jgi:hypothetical protein